MHWNRSRSVALDTSTIDGNQTIVFFDQVEPCGEQQMVDEMVTGFRIQYNTNVSWHQQDRSATRILSNSLAITCNDWLVY